MALRFKVDEDLPQEVALCLRAAGHDALTVLEQQLCGFKDDQLWSIIQAEGRCLITADKGFADARLHPPGTHHGIVLMRLHRESRTGYIRLAEHLVTSGQLQNVRQSIAVITPEAIRVLRSD